MPEIKILKTMESDHGWECTVQINDDDSSTEHLVTIPLTTYSRLTGEQYPVEQLVIKSFEFLLNKESKESILSEFTLDIIGDYFPSWEQEIVK
ncbi:MAG: hypothetical protein ACNFW9_05310 [Candidatus Kerfeldbacteria bacterium]